jgi:hypothetical protein
MKTYDARPEQVQALQWTGEDNDELITWLTDNDYTFRIHEPEEPDLIEVELTEEERDHMGFGPQVKERMLTIVGKQVWQTTTMRPTDWVSLSHKGSLNHHGDKFFRSQFLVD